MQSPIKTTAQAAERTIAMTRWRRSHFDRWTVTRPIADDNPQLSPPVHTLEILTSSY